MNLTEWTRLQIYYSRLARVGKVNSHEDCYGLIPVTMATRGSVVIPFYRNERNNASLSASVSNGGTYSIVNFCGGGGGGGDIPVSTSVSDGDTYSICQLMSMTGKNIPLIVYGDETFHYHLWVVAVVVFCSVRLNSV